MNLQLYETIRKFHRQNSKAEEMFLNTKLKPTESELEILKILWEHGKSTVREVHNHLSEQKNSGYTTTLKLMQIMLEKGLVERNQDLKSHVYSPLLKENEAQEYLLGKLVKSAFRGSTSKLVLHALGSNKTSAKEINEIKKFLDGLEGQDD